MVDGPTDSDYQRLLEFRTGLRLFLNWSERQARSAGLSPALHQLLLAIRGREDAPTVSDVARDLVVRHHSAVALINRAEALGLVERMADPDDQRVVRLRLTPAAHEKLQVLTSAHLEELRRMRPRMASLWRGIEE